MGSTTLQSLPQDLVLRILEEVSRQSAGLLHGTVCREWAESAPGCARAATVRRRYQLPSLREVPNLESLSLLPDMYDCDRFLQIPSGFPSREAAQALSHLRGLQSLEWQRCDNLPREVFHLPLKKLRLSGECLLEAPAVPLRYLSSLEELDFSEVYAPPRSNPTIAHLIAGAPSLRRLRSLGLACYAASFPASLQELPSLKVLTFKLAHSTGLRAAGDEEACFEAIGRLTRLRELTLCLEATLSPTFPESLGNLTGLSKLTLEGEHIRLPDSLSRLTQLRSFKARCSVTASGAYPEVVGALTGLRHLELQMFMARGVPESWSRLTCLTSLQLQGRYRTVPDFFGSFPDLEHLALLSPELACLPPSVRRLRKLKQLITPKAMLWDSRQSTSRGDDAAGDLEPAAQPTECDFHLPSLEKLSLSFARDPEVDLPESVGSLSALQQLQISSYLPLPFAPLRLACHYNPGGLSQLPSSLGSLLNLRVLSISRHKLASLPASLGTLSCLQRLHLEILLHLEAIPESIYQLAALEVLRIEDCPGLKQLPTSLGSLKKLGRLVVSHSCAQAASALECLPDSLGDLPALRTLVLGGLGRVTALPSSLSRLTLLEVLVLDSLGATSLDPALGGMKGLRFLFLQDLPLNSIPDSLGSLTALQHLHLLVCASRPLPRSLASLSYLRKLMCYRGIQVCSPVVGQLIAAGQGEEGQPRLKVEIVNPQRNKIIIPCKRDCMKWIVQRGDTFGGISNSDIQTDDDEDDDEDDEDEDDEHEDEDGEEEGDEEEEEDEEDDDDSSDADDDDGGGQVHKYSVL